MYVCVVYGPNQEQPLPQLSFPSCSKVRGPHPVTACNPKLHLRPNPMQSSSNNWLTTQLTSVIPICQHPLRVHTSRLTPSQMHCNQQDRTPRPWLSWRRGVQKQEPRYILQARTHTTAAKTFSQSHEAATSRVPGQAKTDHLNSTLKKKTFQGAICLKQLCCHTPEHEHSVVVIATHGDMVQSNQD